MTQKEIDNRRRRSKQWNSDNRDRKKANDQLYYQVNKDEKRSYIKQYYQSRKAADPTFKEKKKEYIRQYYQSRKAADPAFKTICNIRSRHNAVLRGKQSTTQHLGCNTDFLRSYLEALWTDGMTWDNYGYGVGKWVIDHILPLNSHHKTDTGEWDPISEYNKRLIHYTNLQPLWFIENAEKGAKI